MYKIVRFEDYCFRCKHRDKDENVCDGCISVAARDDSRMPINFKLVEGMGLAYDSKKGVYYEEEEGKSHIS